MKEKKAGGEESEKGLKSKLPEASPGAEEYFLKHSTIARDLRAQPKQEWRLRPGIVFRLETLADPDTGEMFATGKEFDNLLSELGSRQQAHEYSFVQVHVDKIAEGIFKFLWHYFPKQIPETLIQQLCLHISEQFPEVREKLWKNWMKHLNFEIEESLENFEVKSGLKKLRKLLKVRGRLPAPGVPIPALRPAIEVVDLVDDEPMEVAAETVSMELPDGEEDAANVTLTFNEFEEFTLL